METTTTNTEFNKVERQQIKNTPFTAVYFKDKYYCMLGEFPITDKKFETIKQVEDYVKKKDWDTITRVMCIIFTKLEEFNKTKETNN